VIFLLFGTKTWENFGIFFLVNLINFAKKIENFFSQFFLLKKSDCKFGHYVQMMSVVQEN
jgi:hypothetical protein